MGRQHFNNFLKPDFSMIVQDIKKYFEKNNAQLREIYLVGGYGSEVSVAYNRTKETDIIALMSFVEKTKGDVDLLVSYIPLVVDTQISKEDFESKLNNGTKAGNKEFSIDLWLSDKPIVCRYNPICKIFPVYIYDCEVKHK